MRSRLVTCLALAGLGCSTPSIEHGKRIAHGPLQDVTLLPLTTRTSEGLLGHVLREDGMTPDRSRTIFRGPPRMSETVQRVTVVRELGSEARVAAEYGPLRAELSESTVTHLAYVVEVTGYAEVDPQGQYVPESDCCFNGEADPSCAPGFVLRLVRGTGVVKYLQKAEGSTQLGATEYFQTKLGERYLVVDESSFQDAFFAFEPGDMQRLCSTLPDEASFAALGGAIAEVTFAGSAGVAACWEPCTFGALSVDLHYPKTGYAPVSLMHMCRGQPGEGGSEDRHLRDLG